MAHAMARTLSFLLIYSTRSVGWKAYTTLLTSDVAQLIGCHLDSAQTDGATFVSARIVEEDRRARAVASRQSPYQEGKRQ